jgi:CheY-like chemotaxis protein
MSSKRQALSKAGMLKDVQMLVVDNDADSRYLHKTLFEIYGAQVTSMESIADTMALLEDFTPDILICEIRFFNEDALSLIQRIEALELDQNQAIPILVVSAYCSANFAPSLLAMAAYHMLKPINIDHLVDKVWNLVCLTKSTKEFNLPDWLANHRVWEKYSSAVPKHHMA